MGQGWCGFFLETGVLFVLSLFYIGTAYQIHHCKSSLMFSLLSFWFVKAWFPGGSDGKASARNVWPWFDLWGRKMPWRKKWQPTPILLPRKFHGWRSLVGYSLWGHKESDMTSRVGKIKKKKYYISIAESFSKTWISSIYILHLKYQLYWNLWAYFLKGF